MPGRLFPQLPGNPGGDGTECLVVIVHRGDDVGDDFHMAAMLVFSADSRLEDRPDIGLGEILVSLWPEALDIHPVGIQVRRDQVERFAGYIAMVTKTV